MVIKNASAHINTKSNLTDIHDITMTSVHMKNIQFMAEDIILTGLYIASTIRECVQRVR